MLKHTIPPFFDYRLTMRTIKRIIYQKKEPLVEPMAVTTFGELGPGCTLVQEWLAMRLKAHLLAQPARPNGRDPAKITGRFRADFRLAIIMVCARRAAAMQLGYGLPHASIRGLRTPAPAVDDFTALSNTYISSF